MRLVTKIGVWMIVAGIAFQFLNIITYGLWEIDIDIFGALIFITGLLVLLVGWIYRLVHRKKGKEEKKVEKKKVKKKKRKSSRINKPTSLYTPIIF